jgi:AcrR family transcriptional regulator
MLRVTRVSDACYKNGKARMQSPQEGSNTGEHALKAANGAVTAGRTTIGHAGERYRRLPTGAHGLAREEVERDQRDRLRRAMTELIAQRGYPAVRVTDLTKLARISKPTFYSLYEDKEQLTLEAYEDIAARTAQTSLAAYNVDGTPRERLRASILAYLELCSAEPDAMSLFLFGAFGAGPAALERRNRSLETFERNAETSRDAAPPPPNVALTVKAIFGGLREVAAAHLRDGRADELPDLADELTAWAACYERMPPEAVRAPPIPTPPEPLGGAELISTRARAAQGRLPSGRHDLPRGVVEKSQRERIVDATAEIVAEEGLAGLSIPAIASRASVSHETFYELYSSKQDAFLGAQKVGMHEAFRTAITTYEKHRELGWSIAVAEGLRVLVDFLVSEPAHAHLSIVDTFATSPETLQIRDELLHGFAHYLSEPERPPAPGIDVPDIAAEAVVGGVWQVIHYYIERGHLDALPGAVPEITYLALTPFLGPSEAAEVALRPSPRWIPSERPNAP